MSPRALGLACLASVAIAACQGRQPEALFLNLAPVDDDALAGWTDLALSLHGEEAEYVEVRGEGGGARVELGPLHPSGPFRLEVLGLGADGAAVAWAFSPALLPGDGPTKASLYLSSVATAVAHAGPALVDPQGGLVPEGLPLSVRLGPAELNLAYNRHHLFLDARLAEGGITPGQGLWDGDALVVALDALADSRPGERGIDDLVLAMGPERYQELWNPLGLRVLHDHTPLEDGGRYFAAVPLEQLGANDSPGPSRRMRLGIELREVDGQGGVRTTPWPAGWEGGPDYDLSTAGELFLKTRLLDARAIARDSVALAEDLGAYTRGGAVPLALGAAAGREEVRLYALWDPTALGLAVASRDETFCAQQRAEGDRAAILRDDAVEVVLLLAAEGGGTLSRRALFDLSGSTAFDDLGGGAWQPSGVDFRFDLDGPRPADDCQEGQGWTFLLRLPWSDLGFSEAPPEAGSLLAFDLVVYDNDRGARTHQAFSPMGPSADPEELAELRLFEY